MCHTHIQYTTHSEVMSGKYRVWEWEVPQVQEWKWDNKQRSYRTPGRASNPIAQHIILTIRNNMTLRHTHSCYFHGMFASALATCWVTSHRSYLIYLASRDITDARIIKSEWNLSSMVKKRRDNHMNIKSSVIDVCTWCGSCWTGRVFPNNYTDDGPTTS